MSTARDPLYRRHRFSPEIISHAVWLYFRFPLSLRMVEEMLAARGICVTYETVRQWAMKFGKGFSNQIRQQAQRFLTVHDQIANLFHLPYPDYATAEDRRATRKRAFAVWHNVSKTAAAF